jgi:hypothetical protein
MNNVLHGILKHGGPQDKFASLVFPSGPLQQVAAHLFASLAVAFIAGNQFEPGLKWRGP